MMYAGMLSVSCRTAACGDHVHLRIVEMSRTHGNDCS